MRFLLIPALLACAALTPAADSYQNDGDHAFALFRVKHMDAGYSWGRFNGVSGSISWEAADPSKSTVSVSIAADSLDTHNDKRDQHLKGPDFLDAKQFSTLTFASQSFKKLSGESYEVTGTFTLHGVSKPLTVTVAKTGEGKDPWGNERIGFETSFVIKRADFGMTNMPGGVGDEVTIHLSVEGIKKK